MPLPVFAASATRSAPTAVVYGGLSPPPFAGRVSSSALCAVAVRDQIDTLTCEKLVLDWETRQRKRAGVLTTIRDGSTAGCH